MRLRSFFVIALVLLSRTSFAATSSLLSLEEPLSARSTGMGGAFVAVADDANAVFFNPAGLGFMDGPVMTALFKKELLDMNYTALSGSYPAWSGGLGMALTYFDGGTLVQKELDGTENLLRAQQDLCLDLSYGKNFYERVALGAGIKLVRSNLAGLGGQTAAFDLGLMFRLPIPENDRQTLSLGLAALNLGPDISYAGGSNPIPQLIRFGLAYSLAFTDLSTLTFALDGSVERSREAAFAAGAEYSRKNFIFRLGYGEQSPHVGLGFKVDAHQFDYSFSPLLDDALHVVSYTYHLGPAGFAKGAL